MTRSTQACFLTADHTVCVCVCVVSHTHTPTHTPHGSSPPATPINYFITELERRALNERRAPAQLQGPGRTEDGKKSKGMGKKRKVPENRSSASAFWSLRTARTRARPLHLSSPLAPIRHTGGRRTTRTRARPLHLSSPLSDTWRQLLIAPPSAIQTSDGQAARASRLLACPCARPPRRSRREWRRP